MTEDVVQPESLFCQTYSGINFYYLKPRKESILIRDIAHHLSLENRFCGSTSEAYSVGQHSLWVSEVVALLQQQQLGAPDLVEQLQGLLHDGSEAYIKDIPAPLKQLLGEAYRQIERPIQQTIFERFRVPVVILPRVKQADILAVCAEARDLLLHAPAWLGGKILWPTPIVPQAPKQVEALFLARFQQLWKGLGYPLDDNF